METLWDVVICDLCIYIPGFLLFFIFIFIFHAFGSSRLVTIIDRFSGLLGSGFGG